MNIFKFWHVSVCLHLTVCLILTQFFKDVSKAVIIHVKFGYIQGQRYTYRVLQTIQIELILLCVWAEPADLGSAKTALKLEYEI